MERLEELSGQLNLMEEEDLAIELEGNVKTEVQRKGECCPIGKIWID